MKSQYIGRRSRKGLGRRGGQAGREFNSSSEEPPCVVLDLLSASSGAVQCPCREASQVTVMNYGQSLATVLR